jgi:V-type H+-transporting ATPase subunit a
MPGFLEGHVDSAKIRIRQLTEPEFMAAPSAHELDVLDEATAQHEQRVAHLLESKATLERRQAELIELRHVLRETASFFHVCFERDMSDLRSVAL